ncbi:hypothetical protein VZC42_12550 [Raoultella ornithinolytica]|uniref:hypothetical protein n=1 Tax=Raoultella ornithinolytica TaxID=54291 RepID=UPI00389E3593
MKVKSNFNQSPRRKNYLKTALFGGRMKITQPVSTHLSIALFPQKALAEAT